MKEKPRKQKTGEERYRLFRKAFIILYIITIFSILLLGGMGFYYKLLYKEAIKQGTENTVTAIQMTVACQDLSNLTSEEVLKRTIEMFVLEDIDLLTETEGREL